MLLFAGVVIILGLAIGYCSYNYARDMVTDSKKYEMADTINRIDININFWVLEVTRMAQRAVDGNLIDGVFQNGVSEDTEYLKYLFSDYVHIIETVSDIMIADMDGNICYHYLEHFDKIQNADRLQECFKMAESNRSGESWLGIGESIYQEGEVVTLVKAISQSGEGAAKGILIIEINPEIFRSLLLSNQSLPSSQYTFIVDKNGQLICTNRKVQPMWLEEIEKTFQNGERNFVLEWEKEKYYVFGQYNGLTGWKTYSVVAVEEIFPQADQLRRTIAMIVLVTVLAALLLVALISYSVTIPIGKLSNAMRLVEQENFDVEIPNERKDEIGRLITSFNYMVGKIRQLIFDVYQEKIEQKNAEIRALQAQINPHFLYNTLDSINWMLIDQGELEISEVVISLGEILRYAIGGKERLVPLRREVRYIESYLCIQKNRLEDRLKYQLEFEEETLDFLVPKLILQPIIENAIMHGIEPMKKDGRILVEASMEDSVEDTLREKTLVVRISDNGKGMNEEELEALEEKIAGENNGANIGMRNIRRRIELTYGQEHAMEIQTVPGKGTTVILRMTAKQQEGEMQNGNSNY